MKLKFSKLLTQWQGYLLADQKRRLWSLLFLAVGLVIAGVLHGYNMFHYPYYENDEGVYLSQGYAVGYQGSLADYTYWYDHIPGGWMLIAIWLRLTGGPFTFGFSLFSGRIFMLVVHLLSSVCMFLITKKLTSKNWVAFLAILLFSATPLGVYFHRRLLLDNIMTFWLLLSAVIALWSRYRLRWTMAAGLTAAFSVMSKETGIVAVPPLLYLCFTQLKARQRTIGALLFLLPVGLGIGYFFLYALLKQEFFPGPTHVSLVSTWIYQLSRGQHLPFWHPASDFGASFIDWWSKDPWFLLLTVTSLIWLLISSWRNHLRLGVTLIALCFWLFMMRGGLVFNFYVTPMIALGAITGAVALFDLSKIKHIGRIMVVAIFLSWSFFLNAKPWIADETSPQLASVDWIKRNLPAQAIIGMDHFHLIDMKVSRFSGDPVMTRAHWFWKLQDDPAISGEVINNDWQNIEYFVLTHEFIKQLGAQALPLLSPVLSHSREVASWGPVTSQTYINIPKLTSTNGDWVKIFRVMDRPTIVLFDSWEAYRTQFVAPDGQVNDPQTQSTTSEGQAYAMLRAVAMNDRAQFDLSWQWTKDHLQFRQNDKLISWKWVGDSVTGKQADHNFAPDADIDIATALILASRTWNDPSYLTQSKQMIEDIWRHEVVQIDTGRYVLIGGPWAIKGDIITVNPSYLSPAAFRLFAEVDPQRPWKRLATDSYVLLERSTTLSQVGLPPDWFQINSTTGEIFSATGSGQSIDFGYDAIRVFFRVSQDALWFNDPTAKAFLNKHRFLLEYWQQHQMIPAGFTMAGKPTVDFENNAFYGNFLAYIKIIDPTQYEKMKEAMMRGYQNGQWGPADNYYVQNWAWLGYALAEGKFKYAE